MFGSVFEKYAVTRRRTSSIWSIITVILLAIIPQVAGRNIYAQGDSSQISGTLTKDTTLDANSGPWYVTGDVNVPAGITLTIEAGTTLYFSADKKITIKGRLVAEGTKDNLIHFTRAPGSSSKWKGLQFVDSMKDNRIIYAVLEHARTNNGMVGVVNSSLLIDGAKFDNTDLRRIRFDNASLIVRNCVFTDIFPPGQPPTTDNFSEHIWGSGVLQGGHFIIEKNIFGRTTGHNDAIDLDAPRNDPMPQILNNVFVGGGDDALDLEADVHIEGNLFMHYVKDKYNKAAGEANIISAGGGPERERYYTVVHNVFLGSQHVAQVKDGAFMTFVNNTAAGISASAIYFYLAGRQRGRGAYVDSCIFWRTGPVFNEVIESTQLSVHNSLLLPEWHHFGRGNIYADPCFAETGYWADKNDPNVVVEPGDPNAVWIVGDYHLKSHGGRFDPNSQSWVKDDVTSPCIDVGNLSYPVGYEPFPNGGIINMGAYGGTAEASKSYFGKPVCETIIAGDINGDCRVNFVDFVFMAFHWLEEK